jgi:hypothetical protein
MFRQMEVKDLTTFDNNRDATPKQSIWRKPDAGKRTCTA